MVELVSKYACRHLCSCNAEVHDLHADCLNCCLVQTFRKTYFEKYIWTG